MAKELLAHSFPMHPFPTPWKRQETLRFSDNFRGQSKDALGTNGLTWATLTFQKSFLACEMDGQTL